MRPSLLEVRMLDDGVSIIDVDAGCTEATCICLENPGRFTKSTKPFHRSARLLRIMRHEY